MSKDKKKKKYNFKRFIWYKNMWIKGVKKK